MMPFAFVVPPFLTVFGGKNSKIFAEIEFSVFQDLVKLGHRLGLHDSYDLPPLETHAFNGYSHPFTPFFLIQTDQSQPTVPAPTHAAKKR